jgi:hypothetical protein
MKALRLMLVIPLLAAIAAGCTTARTGADSLASGGDSVTFSWKSTGQTSGTMSATLSDGKSYNGRFFEITDETTADSVGPIWDSWYSGWPAAPYWDDATNFITQYSGRVVANLRSPEGERMRCIFDLIRPRDGMSSGGSGECEMPDGSTIVATFPTS